MKKLVTIVSAVMMLLMLAACAPTIDYSAEQMEEIADGNIALAVLRAYGISEYNKLDADEKVDGVSADITTEAEATYTATASDTLLENGEKYTIAEGAVVSITSDDVAGTNSAKISGTVSWGTGDDAKTVEVSCEGTYGDEETDYKLGPFTVNGNAYYPTYALSGMFGDSI